MKLPYIRNDELHDEIGKNISLLNSISQIKLISLFPFAFLFPLRKEMIIWRMKILTLDLVLFNMRYEKYKAQSMWTLQIYVLQ